MSLPIQGIRPVALPEMPRSGAAAPGAGSAFRGALETALDRVDTYQRSADTAVRQFLAGENEDIHTAALAVQRAELAFELGLQVRNKVVQAYQEIMRMQI